jgi:DNA (cytosine-5)-methyltransferase 1
MFRMLKVAEIQAAMAFRPDYVLCGTAKRDKVRQLGNGVTPPAAEFLFRAVIDALEGRREVEGTGDNYDEYDWSEDVHE